MKAKDAIWFGGSVGIVAAENSEGEIEFLIGTGQGFNEKVDMQHIADYGNRFKIEVINTFLNKHK